MDATRGNQGPNTHYRNNNLVASPDKKAVKNELKALEAKIKTELKSNNVKTDRREDAKALAKQIHEILKENDTEFLTSNKTLTLIKNIDSAVAMILKPKK